MAKRSAMAQKKTSGPSANTQLIIHCRTERCDGRVNEERCTNPPLITFSKNGTIQRRCQDHIGRKNTKTAATPNAQIRAEMWWLR